MTNKVAPQMQKDGSFVDMIEVTALNVNQDVTANPKEVNKINENQLI
jgi:negative regulator of sigma E activity